MKVPRCKGMRDLGPREMAQFRRIETEFRECCSGWGYEEIRTPVVEYLHLFTSAGTLSPDMLGRVYSFLDWDGWSGERVVLRPDGTIPAARFYVENMERSEIARLFYVENVFAFEGTGEQPRERWQCGAELIGGSKPEGDVELLSLALEVLDRLGVGPVEVKVAHAGVIKAFLEGLGLSGEQEADLLDQVFSGNREALRQVDGANPEILRQLDMLFGLKGNSPAFVENLRGAFSQAVPGVVKSLDELARIASLLTGTGYAYQIDFTSGRGFEYYTGIIFSFCCSDRRLGGGGRYDELVRLAGGGDVCASGFALYVEALMDLYGELEAAERVLVKARDGEGLKTSIETARELRQAGHVAEFDLGSRDASTCRWVVDLRSGDGVELVDQSTGRRWRKATAAEVVSLLEEELCK